jgi:hypothetical protein
MKNLCCLIIIAFLGLNTITAQNNNSRFTDDPFIQQMLNQVNDDSLFSYMQGLQDFGTRYLMAPNRKDVAEWIMEKFISFGIEDVRLDSFEWNAGPNYPVMWQYNVEAKIIGAEHPEIELLVMGHYDSVIYPNLGDPMETAPGANDNASGVAAAIECARIIMETNYQPAQTMVFLATAAEEMMFAGVSGAYHYAEQAHIDDRNLRMVINNDMIAWNDGSTRLVLKTDGQSQNITWLAQQIIENYTLLNYHIAHTTLLADLQPFVEKGYNGIWFMEYYLDQYYPYYHTPDDVVDHLHPEFHAEVTKVSLGCLLAAEMHTLDAGLTAITNMPLANCMGIASPVVEIFNYGVDEILSLDYIVFANGETVLESSWEGHIPSFGFVEIEVPEISFPVLENNIVEVEILYVNGLDDHIQINNAIALNFEWGLATPNEIKLFLRLDNNPNETTWVIKDAEGESIYSGGPYSTPNAVITETFYLDQKGCYSFTIYDEGGDGLNIPGSAILYFGSNTQILNVSNFGSKIETHFDVGGTIGITNASWNNDIQVYPNPARDEVSIHSEFLGFDLAYSIYDTQGMILEKGFLTHPETKINLSGLYSGVYIIEFKSFESVVRRKIVKN